MYTPAPWRIEDSGAQSQGEWHYWSIVGERGVITRVGAAQQRGPIDMESNRANASLIAAAPEIAEALDSLVMAIELPGKHCEVEQAMRHARDALAKVRVGR